MTGSTHQTGLEANVVNFMHRWHEQKQLEIPGFVWCRQVDNGCLSGRSFGFSPNGDWVALADKELVLIRSSTQDLHAEYRSDPRIQMTALAWRADNCVVATGDKDGNIKLWNVRQSDEWYICREPFDQWRCPGPINSLAFNGDGQRLAIATAAGEVLIWDTTARHLEIQLTDVVGIPNCLAFSPDGEHLAVGTDAAVVQVWDAKTRAEVHRFEKHNELWEDPEPYCYPDEWDDSPLVKAALADRTLRAVTEIAYSLDGKRLVSIGRDGKAVEYDMTTGTVMNAYGMEADAYAMANPQLFPWLPVIYTDNDEPYRDVALISNPSYEHLAWVTEEFEQVKIQPNGRVIACRRGSWIALFEVDQTP